MGEIACDQRSPLLAVRVPPGLWPGAEEQMRQNADRLVTTWDLYATVRHLAEGRVADPFGLAEIQAYGRLASMPPVKSRRTFVTDLGTGVFQPRSLAQSISENRTCAEAGIDPVVCSWRAPPAIVDY